MTHLWRLQLGRLRKNKLLTFLIFLLFMSLPRSTEAAPDSLLYFNPATYNTAVGSSFTLNAVINPRTNAVTAVSLKVTFDKNKLRLDSITPSSSFPLVLADANINNNDGTATIDLAVGLQDPPITTTSNVAAFAFYALSSASGSAVQFTAESVATAEGESDNVITSRTGATVIITSGDSSSDEDEKKDDKKDKKKSPKRHVSNKPTKLKHGQVKIERGKGFSKNSEVRLYFQLFPGGPFSKPHAIKTDSKGKFLIEYKVPYNKIKGVYKWYALDVRKGKKSKLVRYVVE